MPNVHQITIDATGLTLAGALTNALNQVIEPLAPLEADTLMTGAIQAEASAPAGLLPELVASIAGLIADFDAQPLLVEIDAIRYPEDVVRAWGTVELDLALKPTPPIAIAWPQPPTMTQTAENWRITAQAEITIG